MPVLLSVPSQALASSPDCTRAVLERLQARFPGTFLLVASAGPPPALPPSDRLDWVSLPPDATHGELAVFRATLARLYGVHAIVDLGTEVVDEALFARLAPRLPFEATLRPGTGDGGRLLIERLRTHLARGGKPEAQLRWLGAMGPEVAQLSEKMIKAGTSRVDVRLPLAAQRSLLRRFTDLPALLPTLLRPPRGVSFRLASPSQHPGVLTLVAGFNRALALAARSAP
jgi:hypothetical protein